jgi:phosphohistidine swiveling domain-containing protein
MTTDRPAEYFREHSALADWLRVIGSADRDAIVAEDSTRFGRLRQLNEAIGLPIVATTTFSGSEVDPPASEFADFVVSARGQYALRAFQTGDREKVFRNRNLPLEQLLTWLHSLDLELSDYELEFSQHLPNEWAAILVVNDTGVLGELVAGSLRQLTQGGQTAGQSVGFTFDFAQWRVDSEDPKWRARAESLIKYLTVPADATQALLEERLGCRFAAGQYLQGYFEAIGTPGKEIRFIDFNITLGRQLDGWQVAALSSRTSIPVGSLTGRIASKGQVTAPAKVVYNDRALPMLADGEVLVCVEPTPDMAHLLTRAGGLVADRGGVLSHASIVCRELGIPCIVATNNATEIIPDGVLVTVDADSGYVNVHSADQERL